MRPAGPQARPTHRTAVLAGAVGAGLLSSSAVVAWWAALHGAVAHWYWVHQMDAPDDREPLDMFATAVGHGIVALGGTVVATTLLVGTALLTARRTRSTALWIAGPGLLAALVTLAPAVRRLADPSPVVAADLVRVAVVGLTAVLLVAALCRRRFGAWCAGVPVDDDLLDDDQ